jgi:O-acetyl-ADP-ribose deacetylase
MTELSAEIGKTRLDIVVADITTLDVAAIVNAANRSLLGGGGVDGAIHRAAGPELYEECKMLAGGETGSAKITRGYRLKARHVIHAVGPMWNGGGSDEEALLASCYRTALDLMLPHGARSYGAERTDLNRLSGDFYRHLPVSRRSCRAHRGRHGGLRDRRLPAQHRARGVLLFCTRERGTPQGCVRGAGVGLRSIPLVPAKAGTQEKQSLDSRFRGNERRVELRRG